MEKNVKKTRSGICPYCGSDDVDFYDSDWEDDFFFYEALCRDCESVFTEVFKIEYDGYNVYTHHGDEILYDKNGDEMKRYTK